MKNLQFRNIDDELFFGLLELKARLKCRTWEEFLEKVFSEKFRKELRRMNYKENGVAWAKAIDVRLDTRDKEIVGKGEDELVTSL